CLVIRSNCNAMYFFFVTYLLPPRSSLSPYTTLFRSEPAATTELIIELELLVIVAVTAEAADLELMGMLGPQGPACPSARDRRLRDRKSTRLNSSHVAISYAVFCLKKKMRNISEDAPT